jgi:hypothetical protein
LGKLLREVGDELNLAARQWAWLQAVPVAKSAKVGERSAAVSRLEKFKAEGEINLLPECSAGFLISHFFDVGPTASGGFGGAFGWRELEAWQSCSGVELQPWECRALIAMSREYVAFADKATGPDCPPPWGPEEQTEERRARVARQLEMHFSALMTPKAKPSKVRKRAKKGG